MRITDRHDQSTPAKYALTYDGESVSLWPSVGNWQKPCKSHYVIRNSRVVWYAEWTDRQIERGRARDQAAVRDYFESRSAEPASQESTSSYETGPDAARSQRIFFRRRRG